MSTTMPHRESTAAGASSFPNIDRDGCKIYGTECVLIPGDPAFLCLLCVSFYLSRMATLVFFRRCHNETYLVAFLWLFSRVYARSRVPMRCFQWRFAGSCYSRVVATRLEIISSHKVATWGFWERSPPKGDYLVVQLFL